MKALSNIIKGQNIPPVQFGDPITPETVEAGFNFVDNGIEEKNVYFYHPDHLGSSSHITDVNGDLSQHTEFMAFGEVLFDEHSTSITMPYLFNGKELDSDTGLYYYGARYYDPKVSIFINVDPPVEKTLQPYQYANNNPIRYIDPDGRQNWDVIITGNKSQEAFQQLQASVQGELELSMDNTGKVTAVQVSSGKLSQGASDLLLATIDRGVTVNVSATDNDLVSTGVAPLLGSFMGNEFTGGSSDFPTVSTHQELNADALTNLDNLNNVPGRSTLHETTESYIGGKLSQSSGNSVGSATASDSSNPNSIYRISHDRVVKQGGDIYENFYNEQGQKLYRQPNGSVPGSPTKLIYTTVGNQPFHTVPKQR